MIINLIFITLITSIVTIQASETDPTIYSQSSSKSFRIIVTPADADNLPSPTVLAGSPPSDQRSIPLPRTTKKSTQKNTNAQPTTKGRTKPPEVICTPKIQCCMAAALACIGGIISGFVLFPKKLPDNYQQNDTFRG